METAEFKEKENPARIKHKELFPFNRKRNFINRKVGIQEKQKAQLVHPQLN